MLSAPEPSSPRQRQRRGGSVRQAIVRLNTHEPTEFIDITALIESIVREHRLRDGVVTVQTRHTTTGILVNEHEPMLLADLQTMFERLVPPDVVYGHDDFTRRVPDLGPAERRNGAAHCRAALLRSSESLAVANGALSLGRWQRIFFVDFDGGQQRQVSLTLIGRRSGGRRRADPSR